MKNVMTAGGALLLTTSLAQAGGLDRSGSAYSILFEDGNAAQLSFSTVRPDVSGNYDNSPIPGFEGSSGNMANSYASFGFAAKYAMTEQLDFALFYNQPYGADSEYTNGFYEGLKAQWDSQQIAAVAKYEVSPGISVYGGVRAVESQAVITLPDDLVRFAYQRVAADPTSTPEAAGAAGLIAGFSPPGSLEYNAETEKNTQVGYILGAAYERPEIALRVALTYESGLKHDFKTTENLAAPPIPLPAPSVATIDIGLDDANSTTNIELPQSLTLDFQSGVAANTLVFGSIKWTEWSVWEVRPAGFEAATQGRVTGLDNDVMTYRLGVGQRINDQLSVFSRITYEAGTGDDLNRLSPTDGSTSLGLGGTYTVDNIELTGGVEYAMLGGGEDSAGVEFKDSTALGFGLSVGFSF